MLFGSSNMMGSSYGMNDSQGGSVSASQSGQRVNQTVLGLYKDQLAQSQKAYGQAMGLYTQGINYAKGVLPGIYSGYGKLSRQVMNTLGQGKELGVDGNMGVATPFANAMGVQKQQETGKLSQDMVSKGLGNLTIQGNLKNQVDSVYNMGMSDLGSKLADKAAGYQSGIGLAGLAAQMQGTGMVSGLYANAGGAAMNYHLPAIPNLLESFSQSGSSSSQQSGGRQGSQQQSGSQHPVFTPEEQAQAQRGGGGQLYSKDPTGGRGGAAGSPYQGNFTGGGLYQVASDPNWGQSPVNVGSAYYDEQPSAWDYGPNMNDYMQGQSDNYYGGVQVGSAYYDGGE